VVKRSHLDRRSLAALVALAAAAFCYVTAETLPVGLLPEIAADLDVSPSRVGLLVTWYAVTVMVVTLPLVRLVARVPRRPLMIGLMAALVVATALSAAAPGYGLLLAARVLSALSQAIFWAVVAPVAAGMFPVHLRGRVMAVVFTGGSLGPMLGMPAGTWLGQSAGWQAAFFALAGLGLLAFVTVAVALPNEPARHDHAARGTTPDTRRYGLVLVTMALAVAGFFAFFTYTAEFVTAVAGISAALLGPLLFVRGVINFGGIALGGILTDRNQRLAVALPTALLTLALIAIFALGANPWVATAGIILTGLGMGMFTPAVQNRVMEFAPGSTDTASAGGSIAYNIGIALGSALGGLVLDQAGTRSIALAGALLLAAALATALATAATAHDLGEPAAVPRT
jgi:predicted MFS family arabinose efflux permease